jgi:hypothetical protein
MMQSLDSSLGTPAIIFAIALLGGLGVFGASKLWKSMDNAFDFEPIPAGQTIALKKGGDWERGPTGLFHKGFKDPTKKNAFYEKEK